MYIQRHVQRYPYVQECQPFAEEHARIETTQRPIESILRYGNGELFQGAFKQLLL